MNEPSKLGPFTKGMNNRLPDYALPQDVLRNAVNVDVSNAGSLQRRDGVTISTAGTDVHSLWQDNGLALYIDGAQLCTLTQTMQKSVIKNGLTPGLRASYASILNDVYWSNSAIIERITNKVSYPAGVPVPNPAPVVSAAAGGSLHAGVYQVAITAVSDSGEESGATWPIQVTVPENGKIDISGISTGSNGCNIYVSPLNGDALFLLTALSTGSTSYSMTVSSSLGRKCPTLGLRPMPAGHIVRAHNGRLLVASGNILSYSEPYAPALHNPMRGYIPFPERITIVEPCQNGVYVVADQTYWINGADIGGDTTEVLPVLPYGAIEGTGNIIVDSLADDGNKVWWFSPRGLIVGHADGTVKNLQEDMVAVEKAAFGAGLYREQNGVRQIISSLFGTEVSTAAASSFMSAEVVRKESML